MNTDNPPEESGPTRDHVSADQNGDSGDSSEFSPTQTGQAERLTEAQQVASSAASFAAGSYLVLVVNLLMMLGANSNYAPGGIGIAADFGMVVFHFLVMVPIALYLVVKSLGLLERGGSKLLLLPAALASLASIFIVPIA